MPGGALNVANNIYALGGKVFSCGVIGDDVYGQRLKEVLKKRGIKPTKENIKEEKDKTKKIILNFSKKVIKINVKIKELQEANGQKYFFIGNKKINVKKVNSFLDIPKSKMSHIMFWTSHHRETDKGRFMLYFMKRMFELFVEMEKDSQIKV